MLVRELVSTAFRAMGTDVHAVVLDGDDALLHHACAEVYRLERLWSRFRPGSDVTRVTGAAGTWVCVAHETLELVTAACDARASTGGSFDPLLGGPLASLGYDRSFELVERTRAGAAVLGARGGRSTSAGVEIDQAAHAVRIPSGTALDLGGIAKGWAADRLVAELVERGAAGACVNLGGDVAVAGDAPHGAGWPIAVAHQAAGTSRTVWVSRGGVATSTRLRRSWLGPDGHLRHHLLDPTTGLPCGGDTADVTVVASSAARAEVLTKVAFAAPHRLGDALRATNAAAVVTAIDGATTEVGVLHWAAAG